MKALVVDGQWQPRKDYPVSQSETARRRAIIGSQVWRHPQFRIDERPRPRIAHDEVLIRVKACGICGSDAHLYETDEQGYIIFSGLTKMPCVLGHEFSGVVEQTGRDVVDLKIGDLVAAESVMWCGRCLQCRTGSPNQCEYVELLGLTVDGALAKYVKVNARVCWSINELADAYSREDAFEIGAMIEPVGCAYNGMFIAGGGFKPGGAAAVFGVGPIGLGAVALARIAGAGIVIAFDVIDERVEIAQAMGADHAFNVNKLDGCTPAEKVLELTGRAGADIQIEAAGAAPQTIPEMEKCLSSQGKIVYLGRAATRTSMDLDVLVSGANKVIGARGQCGYGIYPNIIKLLVSKRLDVRQMITARYPFVDVVDALARSVARTDGKILVRMDD